MTTLTNPCSLTRFQTNLHMMINTKSLGQNCRPLSCEMSLVATSEERLRHTVNYQLRLYFNKIFEKNEKDNGSRADVVAKRTKIFSMMRRKVPQLGKKIYSLKNEQFLQLKISNLSFQVCQRLLLVNKLHHVQTQQQNASIWQQMH